MNEQAQLESQMENQPQGVLYQSKADAWRNCNMTIWAKSRSEIIEECTGDIQSSFACSERNDLGFLIGAAQVLA